MIYEGFTEVSPSTYYSRVWPSIKREAILLQSNFKNPTDECFPPLVIIHWGHKDIETGKNTPLAALWSDGEGTDRFWVAPHLI